MKGFTTLELLIVIAVITIVVLAGIVGGVWLVLEALL